MVCDLQLFVLGTTKYSESSLILHAYTQQLGRMTLMLKGIRNAKKGNVRTALFQPLSSLDALVDYKPNRSMHYLKEVKIHRVYTSLHRDIEKSTVVLFLSEVLGQLLQEETAENEGLYTFVLNALIWFDLEEKAPNFHLKFLAELTKFLGIAPNFMGPKTNYFNLESGAYSSFPSKSNSLTDSDLEQWEALHQTTFEALKGLKFNQILRQKLLSQIIVYYRLHLPNFKEPKSLAVLHGLFQ